MMIQRTPTYLQAHLHFFQTHKAKQKMQKSLQANAHGSAWTGANLTRHDFKKTEGQPITGVCCQ